MALLGSLQWDLIDESGIFALRFEASTSLVLNNVLND